MRKFLSNFFILIFSILLCLSILEYGTRILFPHFDPSGHIDFIINSDGTPTTKKRGLLRQIKNTGDYDVLVKIGPLGLRESKSLKTSTPNDFFVVGDSFSFGWGVEESNRFSNILDGLLPNKKVFNISIPTDFIGYKKLISYAKKNGATISNLIIGVTMENDLRNYELVDSAVSKQTIGAGNYSTFNALKYFLKNNSAAYFFVTSVVHKKSILKNIASRLGFIVDNYKVLEVNKFNSTVIKDSAKTLHSITQNFKTLVLIIPSRGLWVGNNNNRKIVDQTHKSFIDALNKLNIDYVDMRGVFEKSGSPLKFHFKHDGHWNKTAHNQAAKRLAKKINTVVQSPNKPE